MFTRFILISLPVLVTVSLSSCSTTTPDGAPAALLNVAHVPDAIPRALPKSRYGNPKSYVINNKRYWVLKTEKGYDKTGMASWYGTKFHGRLTSSRETYDMMKMTAASPELPIPCFASVTNLENHKHIIVKVNDRGPFAKGRIIDLSYAAAKKIDMIKKGTALVRVRTIDTSSKQKPIQPAELKLFTQVGAFRQKYNAQRQLNAIRQWISEPVSIRYRDDKKLYLVLIGPLARVSETRVIEQKIAQKLPGVQTFTYSE